MNKIISFDIRAEFGFLKKPDINEDIYLTFNMLHKPALLGILGAILGLEGYKEKDKLPDYYDRLKDIKVGIEPLYAERGNFPKTVVQYNNGVGYASQEEGGNLIIREQVLIKPAFRCYLLNNNNNPSMECLVKHLKLGFAEYLPYLGKNEFSLWWENFYEHDAEFFDFEKDYKVATIFMKSDQIVREMVQRRIASPFSRIDDKYQFMCFEELPIGFNEQLYQYERRQFVYTNFVLSRELKLESLYKLKGYDGTVQLV